MLIKRLMVCRLRLIIGFFLTFLMMGGIMQSHASDALCAKDHGVKQHTLKSLRKLLRSQRNVPFKIPTAMRYQHAKHLFKQLFEMPMNIHGAEQIDSLKSAPTGSIIDELAKKAGLCGQWLQVSHLKQEYRVLLFMENPATAEGQGAYLFAFNRPLGFVIQAPHQYFDYSTGHIALQLFFENNLRALSINTVHRKQTSQSDMAHYADNLFSAFTEAMAETTSEDSAAKQTGPYLVQLHGFSNQHRKKEAGKKAHIILSNGSRSPSILLQKSQNTLNTTSPFKTYLYGVDTDELGGTKNSSLALLSRFNLPQQFIHIELSANTRIKLKTSRRKREQLWSSLQP